MFFWFSIYIPCALPLELLGVAAAERLRDAGAHRDRGRARERKRRTCFLGECLAHIAGLAPEGSRPTSNERFIFL